jgi:hypothetical protein
LSEGLQEKRRLLISLYEPEMSIRALAKDVGVNEATAKKWLVQEGIYVPRRGRYPKKRSRNPEGEEMLRVCAWCKRVWRDGRWQYGFIPETVQQTHGICEDCERVVYSAIDEDETDERARR